MKQKIALLLGLVVSICSCNQNSITNSNVSTLIDGENMKELITDINFTSGFDLLTTSTNNGREVAAYLSYGGEAKNQDDLPHPWQMSQWWTHNDFQYSTFSKVDEGVFDYRNDSRHVLVNTNNGEITLELNSMVEYQSLYGHSRTGKENWSHLLLEQNFRNAPKVSTLKHIYACLDFVINKANNMDENQAIPCAQLLWYFTITDPKNGDTSYESGKWDGGTPNQFMWFGLPIYDSRYDFVEAYQHADSGFVGATNTIIYNISNREYFNEKLIIGKKYSICIDILPYLKKAYLYGAENGAMDNCEWANLVINYMNFGWELPGSFDTSVTVSKLSVKYEEK